MSNNEACEEPIGRTLWSMCWPLLASSCLVSGIGLVDLFLAGRMGEAAQAAVGIGEQVLCLTIIVGTGLATGTAAFVARHVGGGNYALARLYARDSLKASLVVGLLALVFGFALSHQVFEIFQTDWRVAQVGTHYLQLCSFGNLPFVVSCCLGAIFRSFGAPKYCLYIWLLTAGISITGSFLLAGSSWQWCSNSVEALAIAWDTGSLVGASAGLIWLHKLLRIPATAVQEVERPPRRATHGVAPTVVSVTADIERRVRRATHGGSHVRAAFIAAQGGDEPRPHNAEARSPAVSPGVCATRRLLDIAIVSVPAIVADGCWILANFLVYRILSVVPDATRAQAAWSIALKLEETFALMPLLALNLAAAVIVGQSLGAGNRDRARLAIRQMAAAGAFAMFSLGVVIALSAPVLSSIMSADAGISSWTIALLRAAPALLPLAALWLIVLGGLEGAGDTYLSMICNLLGLICVQLPITWLLVVILGWGATGIWVGLAASRLFLSGAALWGFCRVSPALKAFPQKMLA